MFTSSKTLLPKNTPNCNTCKTCKTYYYNIPVLFIFSNTEQAHDIYNALEKDPKIRKIHVYSSIHKKIISYTITRFSVNSLNELIVSAEIDEYIKNEIDNSENVKVMINMSEFYDIMERRNKNFLDIAVFI